MRPFWGDGGGGKENAPEPDGSGAPDHQQSPCLELQNMGFVDGLMATSSAGGHDCIIEKIPYTFV